MREGTAALLGANQRIEVIGLARDGREASSPPSAAPDVVLLDLNMRSGGLEACARLRARRTARRCSCSRSRGRADLYAALRVEAHGYLDQGHARRQS